MSRSNIVLWAKETLEKNENITIVEDQVRAPTLAEDLALACILAIDKKARGIYNASGKDIMSIFEMVQRIAKFWKLDQNLIKPITTSSLNQKATRPPVTGFDLTKSNEELEYFPNSFEDALSILNKQLKEYL